MSERFSYLSILVLLDADEDKEMAGMLTDYQEIVGFLRVHKLASINTHVCFLVLFLNVKNCSLVHTSFYILRLVTQK